ncbi:MAG: stage V sporulation protein AB [Bacillota bacterium]
MTLKASLAAAITGFAWGLVTGGAIASFFCVLEVIPRLAQLTDTRHAMGLYQTVMGISMAASSFVFDQGLTVQATRWHACARVATVVTGALMGVYVGMLASALAEVLNVLPVLARRFDIQPYMRLLVFSLMLGKLVGSTALWLLPGVP